MHKPTRPHCTHRRREDDREAYLLPCLVPVHFPVHDRAFSSLCVAVVRTHGVDLTEGGREGGREEGRGGREGGRKGRREEGRGGREGGRKGGRSE
jgi:hypothetical protein